MSLTLIRKVYWPESSPQAIAVAEEELLMEGGFRQLSLVEWIYGLGYSLAGTVVLFAVCRRAFIPMSALRAGVPGWATRARP